MDCPLVNKGLKTRNMRLRAPYLESLRSLAVVDAGKLGFIPRVQLLTLSSKKRSFWDHHSYPGIFANW
jgi:hypothetical protein